jgi:hypothetical protein
MSDDEKRRYKPTPIAELMEAITTAAAAAKPLMPSMQMTGGAASGRPPYPMLINPTHKTLGPMVRGTDGRTNALLLGGGNVAMAPDSMASHNDMGMDCQNCDMADMQMLAMSTDQEPDVDAATEMQEAMDPATMRAASSAWHLKAHPSYPHTTDRTRVQVHDARGAPVPPRDWPAGMMRGVTANSTT